MKTIRLLINGASGRMGQAICRLIESDRRFELVAAVRKSPPPGNDSLPWFSLADIDSAPAFDVAVDFGLPDGLEAILALCRRRKVAMVSGATGLSQSQLDALQSTAQDIPLLWAANFSLGVAVLSALTRQAAASLEGWDIDIVESHHRKKRDAPSGTALRLGKSAADAGAATPTYHSLRCGDVVGEHSVILSGQGERIELTHRATDRDVFARGALFAAAWLNGKGSGLYRLEQALGLDDGMTA